MNGKSDESKKVEYYVYMDTETYTGIKFDLENLSICHLLELKRRNFIKSLLMADITKKEIIRKFSFQLDEILRKWPDESDLSRQTRDLLSKEGFGILKKVEKKNA